MNCGLTILGVYAVVCTLTVIILGSLLFSGGDGEERSLMDCRDLQVVGNYMFQTRGARSREVL